MPGTSLGQWPSGWTARSVLRSIEFVYDPPTADPLAANASGLDEKPRPALVDIQALRQFRNTQRHI
ncbi:hypothetical protein GCM10023063_15920 [Arthrobacter methylotrophus]